ncbi:MAG: hypothetical protein LC754_19140 [Acidobacteria bacterium]|nr:hypothetical protein [Acidobacteriota bacterium]
MSKRTFRLLILLHWLLVIPTVFIAVLTKKSLPVELVAFMDAQAKAPAGFARELAGWLYVAATFVGWVGLLLFKNWSRSLVLLCYVIGLVFLANRMAYVRSGWVDAMLNLITTLGGAIFALMYFSPTKDAFESKGEV